MLVTSYCFLLVCVYVRCVPPKTDVLASGRGRKGRCKLDLNFPSKCLHLAEGKGCMILLGSRSRSSKQHGILLVSSAYVGVLF